MFISLRDLDIQGRCSETLEQITDMDNLKKKKRETQTPYSLISYEISFENLYEDFFQTV